LILTRLMLYLFLVAPSAPLPSTAKEIRAFARWLAPDLDPSEVTAAPL